MSLCDRCLHWAGIGCVEGLKGAPRDECESFETRPIGCQECVRLRKENERLREAVPKAPAPHGGLIFPEQWPDAPDCERCDGKAWPWAMRHKGELICPSCLCADHARLERTIEEIEQVIKARGRK